MTNTKLKQLAKKYGTPLYVYDESVIEKQFKTLDKAFKYPKTRINYAAKANSNIHILKILRGLGASLDTSSPGELWLGLKAGFKPKDIIFTGNNLTEEELKFVISKKVRINVDSLSQLELFGKLAPGKKVGIRINPAYGAGHHDHVITAGPNCRFGVDHKKIDDIKKIAKRYDLKITGLHQHIGSGILDAAKYLKGVSILLETAKKFEGLEYLDFGGGLGIPYKPADKPLNVKAVGEIMSERLADFSKKYGRELELYIEPGRFLVAQSGTLLIEATAIKKTPAGDMVAGTNSGMVHLIRPALYEAYHEITNISNPRGHKRPVTIVGNICESTDVFAKKRLIAQVREGDILAIRDAGAYGMAMASRFNGRLLPAEVLLKNKKETVIRRRDTYKDLLPS